uniref:Uncharacterized protein n=1 Tax=Timema genevievae TaxID=629358 RepID=A0A7R9JZM1_TIMGE|nr:unnamed protein product [Timema genevievae]
MSYQGIHRHKSLGTAGLVQHEISALDHATTESMDEIACRLVTYFIRCDGEVDNVQTNFHDGEQSSRHFDVSPDFVERVNKKIREYSHFTCYEVPSYCTHNLLTIYYELVIEKLQYRKRKRTHICVDGEWKTIYKNLRQCTRLGYIPDLPILGGLVQHESSALDHVATEDEELEWYFGQWRSYRGTTGAVSYYRFWGNKHSRFINLC